MADLSIGINLDNRTLSLNIPDETTIEEFKYIAKVNSNNYIAEDTVNGVSRGYYHFLNDNNEAETAIFYQYDGTTTLVNIDSFTLPDNFGTITEVDETATLYEYINRNVHEKVYVISEDYAKTESMAKPDIKAFIRGYGVPVNSVFKYDGNDIPAGFEEVEGIGTTFYFNTIEDMKTTELKSGDIAVTLGYYEPNDGGAGTYQIVEADLTDDGGSVHELDNELFAVIVPTNEINLKMFGAKLNGTTDDTESVINAFNFANENNVKVVQKSGILYIPSSTLNNCPIINTDCDFTGMKIKFDSNSDDKTVMIIADPSTLTDVKTIQNIDLTSEQISSLSKTNTSPITFLEDYKNHYVVFETDMKVGTRAVGYGEDVFYSQGFEVNDLQQLTPNNMYADISVNASEVNMKYLPLNQKHLTIKLPEINIDGNVDNNPMILVMRNNVELLDCIITKTNFTNTTEWSQPLFRCRYCCNLTIKNWVGENVSNEPTNTDITSYIIAIDKCFNVLYENNNLLKAHGCFVSYHTNFINFINNVCDRFDNHYGLFGNVNITNNSFISFPAVINLGYGDGQVNIENCSFYKYDENGKKISGICIDHRVDLTAMYAGIINVNNIKVKGISHTGDERYLTLIQWIPTKNENSIFPTWANYNVPIINAKNINFEATGFYYRYMNVHNNYVSDKEYKLRTINLDSDALGAYTSVLDFAQVDTDSNTKITLNGQRVQLISGTKEVPVTLLSNCNFRGNSASDKINLEVLGNNNVIRNKIWRLKNLGNNNLGTSNEQITITDSLYNFGRLYITTGTIETLKSNGVIAGDTVTINNGIASGEFHVKNLTVGTKLSITGAYVEIETSVTNNGEIYLAGNYMYSSVAGRFNNGTIHGNGNWGGSNSNIINTL